VLGRPLICYTIDALIHAESKRPALRGYQSARMIEAVKTVDSLRWSLLHRKSRLAKQNGGLTLTRQISTSPFLLTMATIYLTSQYRALPGTLSSTNSISHDRKLDQFSMAMMR